MSKSPLLTIITVNLNDVEGLKKTFSSVFNQSWQEFEYVVVDGGSSDGSKELIQKNEGKIDFWVSEPDKGVFNAMNKGIVQSNGKYLLFLNSGDHLRDVDVLQMAVENIRDQDLIYFNLEMYDNQKKFIKSYPDKLNFSFFLNHSLPHPATFIKKELFRREGLYNESSNIISDWTFFLDAVCKRNCSYLYVNQCLTSFNLFGISSAEKMRQRMYLEREEFLNKNYPAFLRDCRDLENCEEIIIKLRSSRKIKWLVKLGLIHKF